MTVTNFRIPFATRRSTRSGLRRGLALGVALVPFILPAPALAAVCPTATFDQVIALGACTIGDATFDFTHPHLASHPVWFNGPFAGNTGVGPAASALTFTPDASAGHPGFALAGDFSAFGQAFRFDPFRGSNTTGNYRDETLSYLQVTPGSGMGLSGYSIGFGDAFVSQSGVDSLILANINSATAVVNDSGFSRLNDSASFGSPVLGPQWFDSNLRTYEYSSNPADVARFGSVVYGFSERAIAPAVPEPESYALMLAGLAAVGAIVRRRRGS
jgi:hypothetical protein